MNFLKTVLAQASVLAALTAPAAAELKVVTTIKPLHGLVARVMEGAGSPSVLVNGAVSPHGFAMKPSDAKAVNDAAVFFRIGAAIEPFTEKIVKSLPASVQVVTLAEAPGITLLSRRTGSTFEAHDHGHDMAHGKKAKHGHDHHDDHAKDHDDHDEGAESRDHHIWLDPENAKAMVAEIARVLAEKDTANGVRFRENAAKLTADIDALSAELANDLKPVTGKPFIVFHDAYQYFERRFGLDAAGSITVSPEVQPSAKRLTAIRKKITKIGAACVFAEPQFQPKLVAAVTEGTKARGGTLDPEGLSIEPGPDAYFTLMRNLSEGLRGCLSQGS